MYLNSPMAIDASGMYQRHPEEHRLKEHEYMNVYRVAKLTRSVDESKLLNLRGGPMIISASGSLRIRINPELGWRVRDPEHLEQILIGEPR